jgi:NADH-quinone oxidoreductase subunit H
MTGFDPFAFDRRLRSPLVLVALAIGAGALTVAAVAALLALAPVRSFLATQFGLSLAVMLVVLFLILNATALCILAERKISAWIQDRYGPNRVGFRGLFQPIADGLKFLLKEDINPAHVDKPLFVLAPGLAFGISLLGFAVIPWAGEVRWPWMPPETPALSTQVASLNIGFLYIIAVASIGVYAIVLAGYASNNKYSFYGGMRAAAQMISYEIPLGLALLVILLTTGTLRLEEIVAQQATSGLWYVLYQPLAFLLLLIGAFAETNRAPFDLAEAEQELVGGYHTEYSALKFGMFFLGEYAHMITNSALMIALFFGGWHLWLFPNIENQSWWAALARFGIYWCKIALFIAFYMVVRWTLPRFRFDQLMRLCWQGLVPAGCLLAAATSLLAAFGLQRHLPACWATNAAVLAACLLYAARSRSPITARQEDLPPTPGISQRNLSHA